MMDMLFLPTVLPAFCLMYFEAILTDAHKYKMLHFLLNWIFNRSVMNLIFSNGIFALKFIFVQPALYLYGIGIFLSFYNSTFLYLQFICVTSIWPKFLFFKPFLHLYL